MRTSGWVKAGHAAAGIARLLPASVLSAFLLVMAAAFLGGWGVVVALVWLLAGLAVLTRVGERAAVRAFLRYRPAPGTGWPPTSPASPRADGSRCTSHRDCPGCSASAGTPSRPVHGQWVPAPAPPRCARTSSKR